MKQLPSLGTLWLTAACLAGIGVPRASADDPAYTFHPFDVPAEAGGFTSAFGINNKGIIVGNFFSVEGFVDGFVFEKNTFTYVTVPGAGFFRGYLNAVNDKGDAVGGFEDPDTGIFHSFLRTRKGKISILPDPEPDALSTEALGINNRGAIVGFFVDADGVRHGFILQKGLYTIYDYPDALRTLLTGINDHAQIVGIAFDGIQRRGFLLDGGDTVLIEVPAAVNTRTSAINNLGQVVGWFDDADGVAHGFLLDDEGYTTLDFPGAADTVLTGINDQGVIVGTYDDFSRGLVATPD
jgi:probable HAF family extracellular repeat protein